MSRDVAVWKPVPYDGLEVGMTFDLVAEIRDGIYWISVGGGKARIAEHRGKLWVLMDSGTRLFDNTIDVVILSGPLLPPEAVGSS
jgi:hypothetical protein